LTIPPESLGFHDQARSRIDAYRADPRNSLLSDRGIADLALAHALIELGSLKQQCERLRASLAGNGRRTAGATNAGPGEMAADLRDGASLDHVVQFYEEGADLVMSIAGLVETGLRAGEAVIVVATGDHLIGVDDRLSARAVDLVAPRLSGQYQTFDAEEMLATLMVDGMPDQARFDAVVGGLVAHARRCWPQVRIFGEMVALLWANDDIVGALLLEELWNELHRRGGFSLLCAYRTDPSSRDLVARFSRVCAEHARVIGPTW
jgi:hypothetical protein